MPLATPITISEGASMIQTRLREWAEPKGGTVSIMANQRHLWEMLADLSQMVANQNPRIAVMWSSDTTLFPSQPDCHRVERVWQVIVVMGRGFYKDGMSGGPAEPFTDSLEAVRDRVRTMLGISDLEEVPSVMYRSTRPLPSILKTPEANAFADASVLEFACHNDIPAIVEQAPGTEGESGADLPPVPPVEAGPYDGVVYFSGDCTFALSPSSDSAPSDGGDGSFVVATQSECEWTAVSDSDWLVTASSGTGDGTVNYTVSANGAVEIRSGTITVEGQVFTVNQAALALPEFEDDWAWWKADAITGKVDGDALAQWDDSSGNGHHLTQASAGIRPVYKTARVNSLPAVSFGSITADSFFDVPDFFSGFTEGEIFLVVRKDYDGEVADGANGEYYGLMALGGTALGGASRADFYGIGYGNGKVSSAFGKADNAGNARPVLGLRQWRKVNISSQASAFTYRIDGVTEFTQGSNTISWGGSKWIGRSDFNDPDSYCRGDIAEIIFYSSVLSEGDRGQV